MMQIKIAIFITIVAILAGCSNTATKTSTITYNASLSEITSRMDTTGNYADVFLKITSDTKTDSSHDYVAKGLYKGKTVGLEIILKSNIPGGLSNGPVGLTENAFVKKGATLKSIGEESDEFIKSMGELYKSPTQRHFSTRPVSADLFSLSDKNFNLQGKEKYSFKLFFEADSEEAQIFMNVNLMDDEIEFSEKDEEYRETLVKIWTE